MIGTSVNPFGGMSFVSGRVLHSYDLRTRQHTTLAASPTTERMPILTGSGASFLVPFEGTVASPDPEQFRHTWDLPPLKFVRMADGRLDPAPLASLDIHVVRSDLFLCIPAPHTGTQA